MSSSFLSFLRAQLHVRPSLNFLASPRGGVCVCALVVTGVLLNCFVLTFPPRFSRGHGSCFPSHANEAMGFSWKGVWTHIPVPAQLLIVGKALMQLQSHTERRHPVGPTSS